MDLGADEVAAIQAYAAEVTETFGKEFAASSNRFKAGQELLDRFKTGIESVLKNGWSSFGAVDEAHNELCIASAILANTRLRFKTLEYEPPIPGTAKTIDFLAEAEDGLIVYID